MSAVWRGGSLVVSMAVTVMFFGVDVLAEDLPARPSIKASALYLVELKSGRVLLEKRRIPIPDGRKTPVRMPRNSSRPGCLPKFRGGCRV